MATLRIISIKFSHYKAFKSFSLQLQEFNVLVGPNNSGKSTIVGALRILHEGMRRAKSKSPERIEVDRIATYGYKINLEGLPVAAENIFHDYDESHPASVTFTLSNGNQLILHFPEAGKCLLVPEIKSGTIKTPKQFREAFDLDIAFVPILGPVEQNEPLYGKEAARLALLTSGASRNFRNIWHHYPEDFDKFRDLIQATWPGMDILPPEVGDDRKSLYMFCPEERLPREICWAGYGFQVWCQMLSFIIKGSNASILVIDEPDIYLHSDLQRQLVSLLRELGPDIVLATHSTEIIAECEPTSLLNISKKNRAASRVRDVSQLKRVFSALGSNLNPTLTQLAKTKRAVFVEGLDFQILSPIARNLGMQRLANRSDFATIQIEGFNPRRAVDLASGIEKTVGGKILRAVVLDRDYRCAGEIAEIEKELQANEFKVHIHERKEIENYLLNESLISSAILTKMKERERRTGRPLQPIPDIRAMLEDCAESIRLDVFAQRLKQYAEFTKRITPNLDQATVTAQFSKDFESDWKDPQRRIAIVPGKELIGLLNKKLQELCALSISDASIASYMRQSTIPADFLKLMQMLEVFGQSPSPD
ncbi:MAG: ATP-dependent nuclease [Acidovorax sp.]|uniref:ATP-dependent nuclease n=1 Tax=Acidovorax sp. TaxID=1872122 RepID=UPI00391B46CC